MNYQKNYSAQYLDKKNNQSIVENESLITVPQLIMLVLAVVLFIASKHIG